jgi:hypothetical protein
MLEQAVFVRFVLNVQNRRMMNVHCVFHVSVSVTVYCSLLDVVTCNFIRHTFYCLPTIYIAHANTLGKFG